MGKNRLLKDVAGDLSVRRALRRKYGKDAVLVGGPPGGYVILPRRLTPEEWREKYANGSLTASLLKPPAPPAAKEGEQE